MGMRGNKGFYESYYESKTSEYRPMSITTEILDTEWEEEEDEEIVSEMEDNEANSPRVSLNSTGQHSMTTVSSYDEAHTPRSSRTREAYPYYFDSSRPVEGPRGPHLFRSSTTSSFDFQDALSLSPITPKTAKPYEIEFRQPFVQDPLPRSTRSSPYQFTHERLDPTSLAVWSPQQVAQWMLNAGIEYPVAEKFIENDINGALLITLKFEDLRELHIKSFGIRTRLWEEIHTLKDKKEMSPRPDTPIEDEESKEVRRERKRMEKVREADAHTEEPSSLSCSKSQKCSQGRLRPSREDIISPLESVSIVGIEQMIPEPHHCSKGVNCKTYKKRQRMIEAFKRDHPFVDMDKGGIILVAGDPGNPETAPALNRPSPTEDQRPQSDAVPSVVASSDILGPGVPPLQYLQEAALRNLQSRDPQDNVRQFLNFQHQDKGVNSSEVPPTPPFELNPRAPHEGLRALPRLSIPGQRQATPKQPFQARPSNLQAEFLPYQMDRAAALSPDLTTPVAPYRFGTPFSEMDVPVTSVPLGPVARDASQSVPPDMGYRAAPLTRNRASHRGSLQIMAPVEEDVVSPSSSQQNYMGTTSPRRRPSLSPKSFSPTKAGSPPKVQTSSRQNPQQAPPRAQYPWSQPFRFPGGPTVVKDAEGIQYQGPVKKRKTKMLRHEWHDQYAVLKGTRLALHKDAASRDRTLEYIDVDDYAIACSSLSTTSKLNAAFKAMNITRGHGKSNSASSEDIAAFSFQLVPQDPDKSSATRRLRKRESQSIGSLPGGVDGSSVNGTGKTHHFAVRSRDERIDWMRELMLAKALRQKGEGFEVSVNGNM
ncbi:hypothetical protein GGS20DRAFT_566949, partial [Poronia punctata]